MKKNILVLAAISLCFLAHGGSDTEDHVVPRSHGGVEKAKRHSPPRRASKKHQKEAVVCLKAAEISSLLQAAKAIEDTNLQSEILLSWADSLKSRLEESRQGVKAGKAPTVDEDKLINELKKIAVELDKLGKTESASLMRNTAVSSSKSFNKIDDILRA